MKDYTNLLDKIKAKGYGYSSLYTEKGYIFKLFKDRKVVATYNVKGGSPNGYGFELMDAAEWAVKFIEQREQAVSA